jgi:hypothetical protein
MSLCTYIILMSLFSNRINRNPIYMRLINNNIIKNHIHELSNIIKNELAILNDKYVKRHRKINVTDLFNFLCYKNGNYSNNSYNSTNYHFTSNKHFDVSNAAIIKKRNLLKSNDFDSINYELLEYIYKDVHQRFIAVDGSDINLLKQILKEIDKNDGEYPLSKSGKYRTGLLSSMIDVERDIPINYSIFRDGNERKAIEAQLGWLRKSDVLIFDMGYYSKELMELLIKKEIGFIFRLSSVNKKYYKLVDESEKGDIVFNHKMNKKLYPLRLVKYELESSKQHIKKYKKNVIDSKQYYLLTSLIDKTCTLDRFKELYHLRWKVETNFRHLKYYASLGRVKTVTEKYVKQDVSIHNFLFILSGFLEHTIIDCCKIKNKKINTKLMMEALTKDILIHLTKNKINYLQINKILFVLQTLLKFLVLIQKDRHYKRESKIPINHWTHIWAFYK